MALSIASDYGHMEVVSRLLVAYAGVASNEVFREALNAGLAASIRSRRVDVVRRLLIEYDDDSVLEEAVLMAKENRDEVIMRLLREKKSGAV